MIINTYHYIYRLFYKREKNGSKFSLVILALIFSVNVNAAQISDVSLLKQAISLRQTHQNNQAITILENLKINHQDHKRINIELVINYLKLNQYDKAETVIEHLYQLPLSANELTKLQALQKRLPKKSNKNKHRIHRFGLTATLYSGIDSISSQFPIYEYIGDINWQDGYEVDVSEEDILVNRGKQTERQSSYYNAEQLKGFYRYAPKKHFTVFGKKTALFWSNKLSLYRQQIQNRDDYQQIKFDSNISLIITKQWLFDLRYRNRSHFYAGKKRLNDQGIQFLLSLPIYNNRLKFGLEKREKTFNSIDIINNSTITTPWLEYAFKISTHFNASFGAQHRQKRALDVFNSYNNTNLYCRLNYTPTEKMSSYLLFNYNKLHYLEDDPVTVNWSREWRKSLALGVNYQFNKQLNIGLNSHVIRNKADNDNGKDEWLRLEAFIGYQF
ncbi:MAG: tetratricopeptide repeat protein [Alteromonadaceae bacterium]|nr:tetratricopeptide repeat protein [Alteromonadaceae bacterium]